MVEIHRIESGNVNCYIVADDSREVIPPAQPLPTIQEWIARSIIPKPSG